MHTLGELDLVLPKTEKWIVNLVAGLDKYADEETRLKIFEECGRKCWLSERGRARSPEKLRAIYKKSKSLDDFLDRLAKIYKHLHREAGKVYIVYPRCLCSQVHRIPKGQLSGTYCNCAIGWVKALFEGAIERPVEVLLEESIVRGDKQCKLQVVL